MRPEHAGRIERVLDVLLPPATLAPERLHQAMRYATLDGGKRLRARLVFATGRIFAADDTTLDAAAAAVELIHAYSLVHDDLPAMDNDSLRRGKPTVHVAFDEATAILAGDALQTLAFETLARAEWEDAVKVKCLRLLLAASGSKGMCGGQQLDMDAGGRRLNLTALQRVHAMKTGALIKASVLLAAAIAGAADEESGALAAFADDLGLAFQIQDDILDIESSSEALGKSAGKDVAQEKSTYPAVLGMVASKALLEELATRMREHLARFDANADALRALAEFAVQRRN
jgi:farnesyl diphosphate synthase